jgi:hypothetical protein
MILIAFFCLLAGVVLGWFLKVYILVPVISIALLPVMGSWGTSEVGSWWLPLAAFMATLAFQIGYVAGGLAREAITWRREESPTPVTRLRQRGNA